MVTLPPMGMTVVAPVRRVAALVLVCSLGACSTADTGRSSVEPTPSSADAQGERPGGALHGGTKHGKGSNADLAQSQGGAESAAGQVASGDGLRVENNTGGPVVLVLPGGDTSRVAAGKSVIVLRPCGQRLPLRAERPTGEFVAERDGPCRERDTWTLD